MKNPIRNILGTGLFLVYLLSAMTGISAILGMGFLCFQYLFSSIFGS